MATKITYATLGGEQLDDLHRALDGAIADAPAAFGREYSLYINGQAIKAERQFDDLSPIDTGILIGKFQQGSRDHAKQAITAARRAYPSWAAQPWQDRLRLVQKIADSIRAHRWELSALMGTKPARTGLSASAMWKRQPISSPITAIKSSGTTDSSSRWPRWDLGKRTSA